MTIGAIMAVTVGYYTGNPWLGFLAGGIAGMLLSLSSATIEGAEALVRLRDQMGKIVPPGKFIPIAEKSGHIIELGRQVLDKTCEFVSTHDMRTLGLNWINVNLSPIQCMQQDIDLQFSKIIGMHHIDPSLIHLEITEESMVDYALLRHQITSLEQRGFTFVLDDYGSGYSNLTRVKHYPFNTIKLDMEVVWDYFKDRDSLLPSIVQGFKSVGLSITAEGIESEEMAQALTNIGSDYLQGFYFSKPLPCDEFEQLLLGSK
jgi:EAL domain-containing protein (putative c-di-GMP-specific phosphodiesterase class I)